MGLKLHALQGSIATCEFTTGNLRFLFQILIELAGPLVAASLCGIGLFWFVSRSLAG